MKRLVSVVTAVGVTILLASGVALAAIIDGTDNGETIVGTEGADIIDGLGGDDRIFGMDSADTILGGGGDDDLFGGNRLQSFREDGASMIKGQLGKDYIVGSSGADILDGGLGADIILEGPANDGAAETIYGGDGDDFINVASIPAHEDGIVDCGPGVDQVEADPLDVIPSNCGEVRIVKRNPDALEPDSGEPAYMPQPADATELPEDASPPDTGEITTQATRSRYFFCDLPPKDRGAVWCVSMSDVYQRNWVKVGSVGDATGVCRDQNFWAYRSKYYLGYAQIGECWDQEDWIYGGGQNWSGGATVSLYGRAAGSRWVSMQGFERIWS